MHEAQKHAGLPWIEYKKASRTGRPIPFPSNPIASRTVCRLEMRQLQIQDHHLPLNTRQGGIDPKGAKQQQLVLSVAFTIVAHGCCRAACRQAPGRLLMIL